MDESKKIILELTLDELKTLDKHIEYNEETKSVFDKIKYAYPQPKMTLENEGDYVVVSYNDTTYYRFRGEDTSSWHIKKGVNVGYPVPTLMVINDAETERLLEGLYYNHIEVKKEKEQKEWKSAALKFGRKFPVILPYSYNELSPNAWYNWAIFVFDEYVKQRDIECGYTRKYQEPEEPNTFTPKEIKELIKEGLEWCEDHPNENPLDWVKPQTPEPSMTNCIITGNPPNGYSSWSDWYNELGSKGILNNLRISSKDYEPTPQTPQETEESLKEAFREGLKQTEKWKEIQKKIDEEDNDKNFKNSLDLIKEWGEKNKPKTLYEICMEWWDEVFVNQLDDNICVDVLVDKINKEFIPPSSERNGYEWEKCLKIMRDKLR